VKHSLSEEGRKRIVGHSALCRLAEANDIASMVEYPLGEDGRNITGAVATVDAGNSA
jgi:3-oxoacyl-[acyl-carrier protein] reductase